MLTISIAFLADCQTLVHESDPRDDHREASAPSNKCPSIGQEGENPRSLEQEQAGSGGIAVSDCAI